MAHSDDNGLVLPPKLAPIQVVIVPIYKNDDEFKRVVQKAKEIHASLTDKGISVKLDDRDTHKPGWKFAEYELKGVPVRIAIGPRDVENNTIEIARRDTLEKQVISSDQLIHVVPELLEDIQSNIFKKALDFRIKNTHRVDTYEAFKKVIEEKGGFVLAHWDGSSETEEKIKEETKATIRCIPLEGEKEEGVCMVTGKKSERRVIFAKAY